MSIAKTDKLGLHLPKELMRLCVCCSLWTNPGKKAEQKQEPRRPQEKSAVSKLAKCSCSASWYEDFFTNKKKKKAGLAEKVYSSTFYFFYLPAIQKHWIKMSFSITYYYKRTKSLNTYYNGFSPYYLSFRSQKHTATRIAI